MPDVSGARPYGAHRHCPRNGFIPARTNMKSARTLPCGPPIPEGSSVAKILIIYIVIVTAREVLSTKNSIWRQIFCPGGQGRDIAGSCSFPGLMPDKGMRPSGLEADIERMRRSPESSCLCPSSQQGEARAATFIAGAALCKQPRAGQPSASGAALARYLSCLR